MSLKNLLKTIKDAHDVEQIEYSLRQVIPLEDFRDSISEIVSREFRNHTTPQERRLDKIKLFELAFSVEGGKKSGFHPSEFSTEAKLCERKLYYQYAGIPADDTFVKVDEADNRIMRLFDLGTMVHLYIQYNLFKFGLLEDLEVPVINEEFGIFGAADGILRINGKRKGLEIKTINKFGFTALKKAKPEHLKQASIYFGELSIDDIVFIYYCKDDSAIAVFEEKTDYQYREEFKAIAKKIIGQFKLNERRAGQDVTAHKKPPRICMKRTTDRALECPFARYCFDFD